MMPHVYAIRHYSELFETAESRQLTRPMEWIKMRTKHDGRSYRRVTRLKTKTEVLLGWYLLLQVAAKMPCRGVLVDIDGPLDAVDLADKTGMPQSVFRNALLELSKPEIGWIERLEWVPEMGFWENIQLLQVTPEYRKRQLEQARRRKIQLDSKSAKKRESVPRSDSFNGSPSASAGGSRIQSDSAGDFKREERIGEEIREEVPSAVSQGRQSAEDESVDSEPEQPTSTDNLIRNPEVAKRLICEKILGGKNPARPWSYDAQARLSELCASGLPLQEILDIGEYRSIPKSDDIPELKARRDPITETGLMGYWGDELTRAREYLKKYRRKAKGDSAKKDEPVRWREFFWWKYDPDCQLPERFDQLDDVQKAEYHRDFEKFETAEGQEHEVAA